MNGTCIIHRGKNYAVKVYLGLDPITKKRRYKWHGGFKTRRDADEFRVRFVHHPAYSAGRGAYGSWRLRLGDYLDEWLETHCREKEVEPTTAARYEQFVRVHIKPALGHLPVARLSPEAIRRLYADLREKPVVRRKQEGGVGRRPMSATTIRHIHNMLHCALEAAVRKEIIARNPADAIEAPARARSEHTIFRADEIQSYLADARETASFPVYVLYVTMVGTGLREGELLGLREADVDLDRGAVLVTQTLKRAGREPRFGRPKTERSRRTVLLPVPVTSELKSLRKWKAIQKLAKGPRFHEYGLVFCGPSGKPLTANNIRYRDHAPRIARLGLRRIRLHDLRHTHASHLIAAGVDPRTVADRLGHSSPSFTLSVYAHAMPWAQERAVQAATNLLLNSRPNEAAR